MSKIVERNSLPAMTSDEIALADKFAEFLFTQNQIVLPTHHTIHAGVYYRTIALKKDEMVCGVLIKIPTTVIIHGAADVYIGSEVIKARGTSVIPANGGRKQVVMAIENVTITMCFKTDAKTIAEAEEEFTDEFDLLQSRTPMGKNTYNITEV